MPFRQFANDISINKSVGKRDKYSSLFHPFLQFEATNNTNRNFTRKKKRCSIVLSFSVSAVIRSWTQNRILGRGRHWFLSKSGKREQNRINDKPQKTPKPKNQAFLVQNRKTDLKNCQNRKNENPNGHLSKVYAHYEYLKRGHLGKYAHGSIWSYKTSILIFFNSYFGSLQLAFCEMVRRVPSVMTFSSSQISLCYCICKTARNECRSSVIALRSGFKAMSNHQTTNVFYLG